MKRWLAVLAVLILSASSCWADYMMYIDGNGITFAPMPKAKALLKVAAPGKTFDNIIEKARARHGIDTALIKAVIKVESNFDPRAVSKKGAAGLMQVMPLNYPALSISNPFDPEQNIMGGTQLLKEFKARYKNNLSLALAAYNAGPTAVEKYGRKIPPYPETKAYVRKVLDYYKAYTKEV